MKNLELFSFSLNDRHRKWRDIKRDPFVQFRSRKIIETGAKFTRSETGKHKTVLQYCSNVPCGERRLTHSTIPI